MGALSALASQLSALRSDIDAVRTGKQDKGSYLTADALDGYARRDEVDGGLATLAGRFASLQDRLGAIGSKVSVISNDRTALFEGLSIGKLVAGVLGLSGPLAVAVIVAGGLVGRRIGRVKAESQSGATGGASTSGFRA